MAKNTNRISGKILSWRRLLTVRHFVCKISHKNYINFYISISQSERSLDRLDARAFSRPSHFHREIALGTRLYFISSTYYFYPDIRVKFIFLRHSL